MVSTNADEATVCAKQGIAICYQNYGGMNSSSDDYRLAVSGSCYDVIVLTETWLNSRTLSCQVFGSDYEVFRCDRNSNNSRESTGGGVRVAVHSGLKAKAVENVSRICLEQIWISMDLGDHTLFLCVLYIAPYRARDNDLIDAHCQSVITILEEASPTDDIIVLGDFNSPGILWVPSLCGFLYPDSERLQLHAGIVGLLDSYSAAMLTQINNVVNENNRTLDLCFVSSQDKAPFISVAPWSSLRTFSLPSATSILLPFHTTFQRPIIVAAWTCFPALTGKPFWTPITLKAPHTFSHILAYVIDRYVPKRIPPPWFSAKLRKLRSTKRAAFRNVSKHRTLPLRNHNVRLNHEYQRACRQRFAQYQQGLENKFKSQPKSFWKYGNDQRMESGLPSSMEMNGVIASTTQEICRLFAKKFASVFSDETISGRQGSIAAGDRPIKQPVAVGAIGS